MVAGMPGMRRRTQPARNQQGEQAMSNYQSSEIKLINTSLIDPHPDNPRKNIGDVTDLADSIRANGLLSPLSVVPNGERYRVIAGHRRLAACKQAGIRAVPCFVLQLGPLQQLDLGATTAAVAHRLGRSADYVRDRAKAASIKADVRKTRDDFDQLTIGQLMAIARYDGQPDRQERLAHAAGTSNFDYILHNIEVEDRRSQWFADVSAILATGTTGLNVIEDPGETFSDSEWHYSGAIFPAAGTPEETIEELRKQNPDAVSVHEATQTIYLWDRRDAAAEAEKEAQRAAEQAERDARQHVLEEYAATTADKRMAWLHGHLHAIKRAKLIETTARLGLLQTIDPDPTGFTKDLHTWNDAACAREQFAAIAGIKPEQALAELHTHLDSPDWPTYAVMILTARIEWFISPNDWDWSGDDNVSRRIPGYYLILQDLGYEPSDDETEHLDQLVAAITEEDEEEDE
nr:MAG TPA_asm: chromosome partitioning protein [Caudoviricetes sp.]